MGKGEDNQVSLSHTFCHRIETETDLSRLWEEYKLLKKLDAENYYSRQEVEEHSLKARYIRNRID